MIIVIISAASGSGKSYLAKSLISELATPERGFHIEADNWHVIDDEYRWSLDEQNNAHSWCRLGFEKAIRSKEYELVIASNTFTTLKELKPYFEICIKYNVPLELMKPDTSWCNNAEECFKRNTHKVPLEVIKNQINRMHNLEYKIYSVDELKQLI